MTNNNLAAHLTHRNVTLLQRKYWKYSPEIIAIYYPPGSNPNNLYPLPPTQLDELIVNIATDSAYEQRNTVDNGYVFVRRSE